MILATDAVAAVHSTKWVTFPQSAVGVGNETAPTFTTTPMSDSSSQPPAPAAIGTRAYPPPVGGSIAAMLVPFCTSDGSAFVNAR